jgi:hypothetical protein
LLEATRGRDALVLGATPEFRLWLAQHGARITLYEKSAFSLAAMTGILNVDLGLPIFQVREKIISADWESHIDDRRAFSCIMGDIVTGYLETPERLAAFLSKLREMLIPNGVFILRDFFKKPFTGDPTLLPVDARRWAYILTPGFATRGTTFSEEMLMQGLFHIGDREALATCASPPRTRLLLEFGDFIQIAQRAGFDISVPVPQTDHPSPALLVLRRFDRFWI